MKPAFYKPVPQQIGDPLGFSEIRLFAWHRSISPARVNSTTLMSRDTSSDRCSRVLADEARILRFALPVRTRERVKRPSS